jgi:spore coat protein CotH
MDYESDHPPGNTPRVRFLENRRFRRLYETKYEVLFEQLYRRGFAASTIEQFSALFGRENVHRTL